MGWTLLYIAFGAVAVWLLAEVLLQYKARLRWRLLAFGGFAMVVVGVVLMSSLVVISLGAVAFAVGQTFVTLSYRRGFTAGWALGGMPGTSKRRREVRPMPPEDGAGPHPEAREPEAYDAPEARPPRDSPAYRPEPLPDDTGGYGVYERNGGPSEEPHQDGRGGQDGQDDRYATADYAGYPGYDQGGRYGGSYDYDYGYGGGEQYTGYSDPYADASGGPSYDDRYATASDGTQGAQGYAAPDPSAYSDGYGTGYPADPYAGGQQPYGQTPPDGVWVPQQRGTEPRTGPYDGPAAEGYDPNGHGSSGYDPNGGGYDTSSGTGYYYGEQQPRY